jgi:hypothetical protein
MGTVQNSILALVMEWGNPKAWAIHLDAMLLAAVYGVRISKFSCTFFFVLFFFWYKIIQAGFARLWSYFLQTPRRVLEVAEVLRSPREGRLCDLREEWVARPSRLIITKVYIPDNLSNINYDDKLVKFTRTRLWDYDYDDKF